MSTIFLAAFDAAEGKRWSVEVNIGIYPTPEDSPGCLRTQKRHLAGALSLLRLNPDAPVSERQETADFLGLDLVAIQASAKRIRDGPSFVECGKLVREIIEALPPSRATTAKLVSLGVTLGFWGDPIGE
jgi:hypothetical protein